jgi:methionyl-tRNA formyltransferase
LLQEVLVCWLRGDIAPRPQNDADAIYSGKITKEDGEIDWRLPTVDIWRRVRAFQPWPGCYTRWEGKQLKIFETVPKPGGKTVKAGQVIALNDREAAFGVWAGDGILGILKVQLEGKRAMSAVEFLRGNGELVGAILPN